MKSVMAMRSWRRPIAIGISALIEEFFFRGILIAIAIDLLQFDGWAAIMLSGILFVVQQAVQVRTVLQLVLISSSCIAISLIGGLAVLVSHSLVPALLAHATFVIFYGSRLGNLELETSLRASRSH
ncbi:CPBP family glutamic-type intramembrane protease [Rhizobium leguminosarum]|uniref:CPBP family glutamic-type intramembrane protease n=1 Tax=Rhizobium leguminosarum TaxID=384 RepID=UPI000380FC1F|nr:CPBP family glutamic-type intramembrane protease [Rhizobium leguminosarum]